jgi:hypothetical protein
MSTQDIGLLREMEQAVASFSTGTLALGDLVEKLLVLRDSLTLTDQDWLREFTQHVVTLDSASVEPPTEAKDAAAVSAAVEVAVREISRLIRSRIGQGKDA